LKFESTIRTSGAIAAPSIMRSFKLSIAGSFGHVSNASGVPPLVSCVWHSCAGVADRVERYILIRRHSPISRVSR
jgi:hypothetical protein